MKLLAQNAQNALGKIPLPDELKNFGDVQGGALGKFLQIFIMLIIVGGGIYALFNLVLAGYAFMGAGDDPKKMEGAWAKIWQTAMGLLFMAGAFVLAAIFGQLIFNNPLFILNPTIPAL
jgi:hypothetical protein